MLLYGLRCAAACKESIRRYGGRMSPINDARNWDAGILFGAMEHWATRRAQWSWMGICNSVGKDIVMRWALFCNVWGIGAQHNRDIPIRDFADHGFILGEK
jgi:hypothetical protein